MTLNSARSAPGGDLRPATRGGMFSLRAATGVAVLWLIAELARGGLPCTPAYCVALLVVWMLWTGSKDGSWKYSPAAVFFVCAAFYLSTFRWHGGDDAPTSLIPFCLLRYRTLAMNPVLDPWFAGKTHDFTVTFGPHVLSVFPVTAGVMAAPVYLIPALTGVAPGETFLHNLSKLSASLITAASAAALYRALSLRRAPGGTGGAGRRGRPIPRACSDQWALCLALLYGLGSWAMSVSSQALWQHGPAALGVALGLLGMESEGFPADALFGFGFALAAAARPDNIFYAAAAGLFVLFQRRKRLAGFCAGAALPALFLAGYWLHYTGMLRPPESQFQSGLFTGFQPAALIGLALSPTRGLLFFFPAFAFGIWGGIKRAKDGGAWLLAACGATWIFMTFYRNWMGGNTFGPRYFATAALVLAFLCADLERDVRSRPGVLGAWCAAVAAPILVHFTGAYFNWPGTDHETPDRLWRWSLNPILNLYTAAGGLGELPAWLRFGVVSFAVGLAARLAGGLRDVLASGPAVPGEGGGGPGPAP